MSKSKNNGLFKQDSIIGQFKRDARSTSKNSAVDQCMKTNIKRRQPAGEIDFVPGSPAHLEWLQNRNK